MSGVTSFFDTNILVYHFQDVGSPKHKVAEKLIHNALRTGEGAVSAQVMQECANVYFRSEPSSTLFLERYFQDVVLPLYRLDTNAELIASASEIKVRTKYHFYDSLIIAAALACGAKTLYSEDLQHNQRIDSLTIVNPFI
jgi:predicted nucleic acid-binding protein